MKPHDLGARLRMSPYSVDIGTSGIESIDVEIRDIIVAVNALPFVERTLFSCAGYGTAGTSRNPDDAPAGDLTGHDADNAPYLVVAYRAGSAYQAFHDAMTEAVKWPWPTPTLEDADVATYRIHWTPHHRMSRIPFITTAWNDVRKVIARYSVPT